MINVIKRFTKLKDVPALSGQGSKVWAVKSDASGMEFSTIANAHISATAAIAESKLNLNYATHATATAGDGISILGQAVTNSDRGSVAIASHLSAYNHDNFSLVGHNHDLSYSALGHNHDLAYAALSHSHAIGDVTGLQTALDGKSSTSHNHDLAYSALGHNHSGVYEPVFTTLAITKGGTGQTTANDALNAFLPSQTGNSGKYLTTDGTNTSWDVSSATDNTKVLKTGDTMTGTLTITPSTLDSKSIYLNQTGTLTVSTTNPTAHIYRNLTLGAYDATGALLKIEDNTASTGYLLYLIKQGDDRFYMKGDGYVRIASNPTSGDGVYISRGALGSGGSALKVYANNANGIGLEAVGNASGGIGVKAGGYLYGGQFEAYAGATSAVYADARATSAKGVQVDFFTNNGLYLNQTGTLTASTTNESARIYRNLTLDVYDAAGALLKIEDNTASTGKLLHLIKETVDKAYVDKDGNAYLAGNLLVGSTNSLTGSYSTVVSGSNNSIINADYSVIVGGNTNSIDGGSENNIIASGNSSITGSGQACIVCGFTNSITGSGPAYILGGESCLIENSDTSIIFGGRDNTITGATFSTILGGVYTTISANSAVIIGKGVNNGNRLTNNIANSLMVGFNSTIPTFFVGTSAGVGTTGSVGIGTSTPASKLHVAGGDIEITAYEKGLILTSPNATRYRITVNDDGSLTTTSL